MPALLKGEGGAIPAAPPMKGDSVCMNPVHENNDKYVLFSPVGGTDPITDTYDGSLLHICRHYRPACVMLYLSAEMCGYHNKDDRYRRALRKLMDEDGFIMEILCEKRLEMNDPHLFDQFYSDFERCLKALHKDYPKHKLLVNLSSGTPAMKSELAVLTQLSSVPVKGIQVASPNRRINRPRREIVEYDLEINWELNQDRDPKQRSRCIPSAQKNLRAKLLRETIEAHLEYADYAAVQHVSAQLGDLISDDTRQLINAAAERSRNHGARLDDEMKGRLGFIPGQSTKQAIFEYLLILQTHLKCGRTADFLRGMTPALYQLSLYALRNKAQIDMRNFCNDGRLNADALKRDRPDIYQLLLNGNYDLNRSQFLSSEICCYLLTELCPRDGFSARFVQLRDVEKNLRNSVAHTIKPLTPGDFAYARSVFQIDRNQQEIDVLSAIWETFQSVTEDVFTCRNLPWDSYDSMNQVILAAIDADLS